MTTKRMLYKYRTLGGQYGIANAEHVLLRDKIRWQSPTSFNDPFDCVPRFDTRIYTVAFKNWMNDAQKRSGMHIPRADRRAAITRKAKSKEEFIRSLEASFVEDLSGSSVTCFSLVANQPLMWAHYADAHAGALFEFEEPIQDINFHGLNVEYVGQRPLVDPTGFLAGNEEIEKAILTRSFDWAYEKEVRVIDYRRAPGPRLFNPALLKSVTLGMRISDAHRTAIIDMVARRPISIPVMRAAFDGASYKITSNPA